VLPDCEARASTGGRCTAALVISVRSSGTGLTSDNSPSRQEPSSVHVLLTFMCSMTVRRDGQIDTLHRPFWSRNRCRSSQRRSGPFLRQYPPAIRPGALHRSEEDRIDTIEVGPRIQWLRLANFDGCTRPAPQLPYRFSRATRRFVRLEQTSRLTRFGSPHVLSIRGA
jgi:hypothetical protein